MLQTFPPRYRFVKPGDQIHFKTVGRMIGNAVPVRLGQVIGESIVEHVARYARFSNPQYSSHDQESRSKDS